MKSEGTKEIQYDTFPNKNPKYETLSMIYFWKILIKRKKALRNNLFAYLTLNIIVTLNREKKS